MNKKDQPPASIEPGYISAAQAERHVGVTSDHIGLLCRKGKIDGKRVGRVWYVREQSLIDYLQKTELERAARHKALSEQMRAEQRERDFAKDEFFAVTIRPAFALAFILTTSAAGWMALPQPLVRDTVAGFGDASAYVYGTVAQEFVDGVYTAGDLQQEAYTVAGAVLNGAYGFAYMRSDMLAVQAASAIRSTGQAADVEQLSYLQYLPDEMINTTLRYEIAVGDAYFAAGNAFVDATHVLRDLSAVAYGTAAGSIMHRFDELTDSLAHSSVAAVGWLNGSDERAVAEFAPTATRTDKPEVTLTAVVILAGDETETFSYPLVTTPYPTQQTGQ